MNTEIMPTYYQAKLAADEALTVLGEEKGFQYIILRPGQLVDDAETGRVVIGKTPAKGSVTRGDVAEVGVRLLERNDAQGWFDLLGGEKDLGEEVERVVKDRVNSMEGEDLQAMKESIEKL